MEENKHSYDANTFLELELQEAFENYRTILKLVVSIFTLLVTANITVIGYALANKVTILFAAGAIFPIAGLLLLLFFGRMFVPITYTAFMIEQTTTNRPDCFWGVLLAMMASSTIPKIKGILEIEDPQERVKQLSKQLSGFLSFGGLTFWGALILSLLQIIAIPALHYIFGWSYI